RTPRADRPDRRQRPGPRMPRHDPTPTAAGTHAPRRRPQHWGLRSPRAIPYRPAVNPTELIAPRPTSADERRRRIDHVEKLARERPRAYAVRLALLTGLGYAYVLGMLALACWAAF